MKNKHREILASRWPELLASLDSARAVDRFELEGTPAKALSIDGIQMGSAYDPVVEAKLQARLIPAASSHATVYGIGNGALARTLLARPHIDRLDVFLLDFGSARESFGFFEHEDWLADERVNLIDGAEAVELTFPFAANPSALRLASGDAIRLRDLIELELATPYVMRRLEESVSDLADRMRQNEPFVAKDDDVEELFGAHVGETALIVGPTELRGEELNRLRRRASTEFLVAVEEALGGLLTEGITPDIVITMNAGDTDLEELAEDHRDELADALLVYSPVVPHGVLLRWPGRRAAAYGFHERFKALTERHSRGQLWSAGCDLHAAIDLGVRTGVKRVELHGASFALPTLAEAQEENGQLGTRTWVLGMNGERISTLPNLKGHLRDLERYIAAHTDVEFLNTTRTGALIEGTLTEEEAARA